MKNQNASKKPLKLWQAAREAMSHAHSPYSNVKVGAAVLMTDGDIYSGCNVENASYGATICAERTAILKAISSGSSKKVSSILITTNQKNIWPPCGMCRQVLAEFSSTTTKVYCTNNKGDVVEMAFGDVFPGSFDQSFLKKKTKS